MSEENKELIDASFAEKELIKLLKKLDPWNSGFWKIHLEKVKEEQFKRGYEIASTDLHKSLSEII